MKAANPPKIGSSGLDYPGGPDRVSRALKTAQGKQKSFRKRDVTTGVGSKTCDVAGFADRGSET